MLVKGVSVEREKNDMNMDYIYVDESENQGLRVFMHKYFLGFQQYYLIAKNEEFFKDAEQE